MNSIRSFRAVASLAACFALSVPAFAAPVSPEGAAELVKGYASYTGGQLLDGAVRTPAGAPRPVSAEIDGEEVVLAWAFQMQPQGWILVSADDRMAPVAGFSAEGALDEALWDPVSPPYHFVRGTLAGMYRAATGAPAPAAAGEGEEDSEAVAVEALKSDAVSRWAKYRAAAEPADDELPASPPNDVADLRVDKILGDIRWSQSGNGENYYTPSNFVCGCVQTALGQIMYYHKWPQTGIGRISHTVSVSANGTSTRPTLTTRGGDGNGGPYKWDTMTPYSTSNDAQREARGALLFDIGVLNGASYASGGTGANQGTDVITGTFKYASAFRWSLNHASITNMFCANFDAGYPVDACSVEHQVVFDGYGFEDGALYYHVNLGWGGSSDGWYLFNDWHGYYLQATVFNIFPQKTGEIVSGRVLRPDGSPFSGVTVTVKGSGGSTIGTATSNAKGIWAYVGVPSSSTISVTASASGYAFETISVAMGKSAMNVVGNRWGVDLIAFNASKGTVRGRVTDANGFPVPGFRVAAADGSATATTAADGYYSLEVSPGWSGAVKPASGQGAVTSEPAQHSVSSVAAGAFVKDKDFVVSIRHYVDADATGAGDGSSWADAWPSLVSALAAAPSGAEIWVAEGTYKPTTGSDRKARFVVPARVKVYGGFSGVETKRSERDWIKHRTVLSGEIGSASSRTDNSPMLVLGAKGAALDGFVLTAAYCSNSDSYSNLGVPSLTYGTIAATGTGKNAEDFGFVVEHCLVEDNDYNCPVVIGFVKMRNCVVRGNRSTSSYGRMTEGGRFEYCTVVGNTGSCFNAGSYWVGLTMTYFYNCYFSNPGLTGTRYYYSGSSYSGYNFHTANEAPTDTGTNGCNVVVGSETPSTDAATPGRPPTGSRAVDSSNPNSGSCQWAETDASATDFAGRPRLLGSAPDRGAWELTDHGGSDGPLGTVCAIEVGDTTATMQWTFNGSAARPSSSVQLYVSSAPSFNYYSNVVDKSLGTKTAGDTGTYDVSGLKPDTVYYARLSFYPGTSDVYVFRTGVGSPPMFSSVRATAVGEEDATVEIGLSSLGANSSSAAVAVQLARTRDFADVLDSKPLSFSAPGAKTVSFDGLDDNTTYVVRGVATASNGLVYESRAADFTTLYVPNKPPKIGAVAVTDLTSSGAVLDVQILKVGNGNAAAGVKVEVSTSPSFASIAASSATQTFSAPGTKSFSVSGLSPGVLYYVRVVATGATNGLSSNDATKTFETIDPQRPTGSVAPGTTTLYTIPVTWTLASLGSGNTSATLSVEYGTTENYGKSVSIGSKTAASSGSVTISDLEPETEYLVRLRAVGSPTGKIFLSAPVRVSTQPVGKPTATASLGTPTQTSVSVSWGLTTLGEGAKNASVYVDWGTTTDFADGTLTAATGRTSAGSGTANVTGLEPGTKYYVRVRAVNDAGKVGVSATRTFTTVQPDAPTFEISATPHRTGATIFADVSLLGHQASSVGGTVVVSTLSSLSPAVATANLTTASAAPAQLVAVVSGLSADTTYYYSVTAKNDKNKSATKTGTFKTTAGGTVAYGEGHWEGGLLQGYNQGNGQQWGLAVGKSDVENAAWNGSGFAASFARGAIAAYQTKGSWTNPYDGATYPMDNYNRMWAYGGQMWMDKGRTYYFAVNFFISAAVSVDGTVVASETDGGKTAPTIKSYTATRTGWHDVKAAVASNGNGCGAAGNPWNGGSPFASLKYGIAWNTNGLSSVTSGNASQWSRLMDEGDRHVLRARGSKPETVFLDGQPTWTSSTMSVPVTVDATAGGRTLEVYASRSPDAWYFADRWEKKVTVGTVAAGASLKTANFTGIDATTNWYVSARLYDSSGYDEWTDAVLFEPFIAGGDRPPAIGGVSAEATGRTAATVEVDLAELGDGSSSVSLQVFLAAAGGAFGATPAATATMAATGTKSFSLTGLAAGTEYAVRVVATGSNGLSSTDESATFATPAAQPPSGAVAVGTPDYTSNAATVAVSSLGDDATSVAIVLEYSTSADFSSSRTVSLGSVGAPGSKSTTLSGLAQGTTYYVRAVLTGSPSGATFTTPSVAFRTLEPSAPAIGAVTVSATPTSATVSVPVTDIGPGSTSATVKVVVNGVTKTKTLTAAGTATFTFDGLVPESDYTAAVTATGSNGMASTASKAFQTPEADSTAWFDVKWSSQGWGSGAAWRTSAGENAAGGAWSVPSGDASSRSGSLLALGLPEGGVLRFTARSPSASKATVKVQGAFTPELASAPPDPPAGALAGLCFARGGYKGWNGAQWVPLSGATPVAASTAWTATFDYSQTKPRVRYAVGGTTLTASGSEWIPLSASQSYVSGVGYAGGGSVGDFKASYTGGGFVAPILSTVENGGHAPLGFGRDSSNNPTFEITVRNAAKDAWYTVYAADAVDGAYKAVTSVKAAADGLKTLAIPAPASKPARFVRIGVSDAQVPENTAL